jgi:hypothetical protein
MTEEQMCVVCGVRPAGSLTTRRIKSEGVTLYCSGDCSKAAIKNFKRRMNGDTVAKLVLTLKNLTEQYSGTVSGNQWLEAFREQYKSQRAFERTVALTSAIRGIANRTNIQINEHSTKSWTFKYLGGNTISEWLKPSVRTKFDEIRLEVGGTAAEGLTSEPTAKAEMSAETKLSKTSCCCGATQDKPCACMKAPEPMKCSAVEPKCACYRDLESKGIGPYDKVSSFGHWPEIPKKVIKERAAKWKAKYEAETMTKNQAKKRFLALMKPYWLKDLKKARGSKPKKSDEHYGADLEDWDWWNDHIKTVETGKYAMASTGGDTFLRESLPYSYYAFINLLPIEWKGHEKYDEEPYDTDEYLLNDDWCIYRRETPWSEWSAADRRKWKKLENSEMDYLDYVEQLSEIESKYDKTVQHKSEAAKMKCKHCGPYYSNMNNMNNWNILSVVENPSFYDYWEYPASLKKQVKALIPALKGVLAAKPAAKPVAKAPAKAKSGRKGPDISATKRKIGTRMRGNDGNMWEVKPAGKSQRWVRGAETFEASRGGRGHQLMTKELSAKIPELYSQEEVADPIVVAHYFSPYARQADWFVIEWDGEDLMFGLADLGYPELGYWTLSELESARRGSLPLVERDLHWTPVPLSEVRKTRMSAEGESPSRDNDHVAVGDYVRSYDFVMPFSNELIRDDCYVEGRVTKIDSWEWCGPNCDHFFILVEKMVRNGEEVAVPPGYDMCYPPTSDESFVQIISRKEAEEREEYGCDRCGEEVPDGNAYYPKVSGDDDDTRICEDCYFEDSQFSIYEAQSWKSCAMCGEPASFTVYDTPVGIRNFCCERCYAQYVGLPVEEPGYYGLEAEEYVAQLSVPEQKIIEHRLRKALENDYSGAELEELIEQGLNSRVSDLSDTINISDFAAEDWNWGGDPDGPLAKALRRAKNSPKKTKPLELVRLDDLEESKDAETWYGPFGIETRSATGQFKKWEKVETYEKLIEKLNQMFNEEGFAPYALEVYAERMPRVEMTRAGPVVVNDRKVLLATYKYGKWESGPWRHLMPRPTRP